MLMLNSSANGRLLLLACQQKRRLLAVPEAHITK